MPSLLLALCCSVPPQPVGAPVVPPVPEASREPTSRPGVASGDVPPALAGRALPGPLELARLEGLSAPAWLSEPLSPDQGLAGWTALDALVDQTHLQPVLVPEAWNAVRPPGEDLSGQLEQARAVDPLAAAAGFEAERRAEHRAQAERYPELGSGFYVEERQQLDGLGASSLPSQADPLPFDFQTATDQLRRMYEDMQQRARAGGNEAQAASMQAAIDRLDDRVRLLVVEEPLPHLVPVLLQLGGWNENPLPVQHAALFASWRTRFDARLVFLGGDTLEFQVGRPPDTLEATRQLAWEQFLYCSDIVYQGVGSAPELARTLHRAPHWYFWWD